METGKTGKYIKYAIGEILLVVIGILIALQINNWNESQKERKEEQKALLNLKEDFEYNYRILDSFINQQVKNNKSHFWILNHTGKKPKPKTEKEFNIKLNEVYNIPTFHPRIGYLTELLSSGRIGIIKNETLRNVLISWQPALERIKYREMIRDKDLVTITDIIKEKGSWLNLDEASSSETVKRNRFPKSGFDVDNRELLDELAFENAIENAVYSNDLVVIIQKNALDIVKTIVTLIDDDLEK